MMPARTYAAAERFILSREFFGMKLGLENIRGFLESVGDPQYKYTTIHVSGTNGKGSTSAMLEAVLRAAGYRTGLFTSPHLVSLRERVRVNGRDITQGAVAAFVERHQKELRRRKLSYFEVMTALGFDYFARRKVDVAVIEVGLGGRLDASNVLQPALTITTDINFDHMEILGDTLAKIAGEKAGIVKGGVPHLIGLLPKEAESVFRRNCQRLKAPLHRLGSGDFTSNVQDMTMDFHYDGVALHHVKPSLEGVYQLRNAALVLKAISLLRASGLAIPESAIRNGIGKTYWPGRFQVRKYRGKPTHLFDVSHNAPGISAFVDSFKTRYPGKHAAIIAGFVKKKEHQKMFDALSEISSFYALVPLPTERSTDVNELASTIEFRGIPFRKFGTLRTAYYTLLKKLTSDDIIVILGSHYLVGEFFQQFKVK